MLLCKYLKYKLIFWSHFSELTNHFSSARHGIFRNRVHLLLGQHLPAALLVFTHLHQHHAEVGAPQIQSQEVTHLCQNTQAVTAWAEALELQRLSATEKKSTHLIPRGWNRRMWAAFSRWLPRACLDAGLSPFDSASSSSLRWGLFYSAWTLTGSALPARKWEVK